MLANYADNVIVPRYADFQEKVATMDATADAFTTSPDVATLSDLRSDWEAAYLSWQRCSMFEFGPASAVVLRSTCNTFPHRYE